MPGHKGRLTGYENDITEIEGADNLALPRGIIQSSQKQAAEFFGAARTFYCTGGSTACIHAMLLYLEHGCRILLARDAHRAVVTGCAIAGLDAVYAFESSKDVTVQSIEAALNANAGAKAVMLTRPDYCGMCFDIEAVAGVCRKRGVLLLVDEAHGAHFPFSKLLPASAAGFADLWCDSAHKTLPALNGAAYLHAGAGISYSRLSAMLAAVHTSSPSYPVLASLETAYVRPLDWTLQVQRAVRLKKLITRLGYGVMESDDPTRVVIDVSSRTNGYAAERRLVAANIFVEAAELQRLILITSPMDEKSWYESLLKALDAMPVKQSSRVSDYPAPVSGERAMSFREAMFAPSDDVALSNAEGRVAASMIGVYPPGSAVVSPGEIITRENIDYMTYLHSLGAELIGIPCRCVAGDR